VADRLYATPAREYGAGIAKMGLNEVQELSTMAKPSKDKDIEPNHSQKQAEKLPSQDTLAAINELESGQGEAMTLDEVQE